MINQKPEARLLSGIPSPSGLLEELRRIDFEDAKATVPSVSRCLDDLLGGPNERDQNMRCVEGLEMGLYLEVLRPEVDALGRWSHSYRYQKPVRLWRSEGYGTVEPSKN